MSGTISATGTTTIVYTGQIVTETVQTSGYYDVIAIGAAGGAVSGSEAETGGAGAEIGGTTYLRQGDLIQIAVGGEGQSATQAFNPGGGGGGSFVVGPNMTPIVIAGGGGGAAPYSAGSNDSDTVFGTSAGEAVAAPSRGSDLAAPAAVAAAG